MQLQDLEVWKDIPGYRAILKAVLKSQIQMLVEQLCEETGEESVILTASINDGTLCHLGSSHGKNFLDGREDLKSQFLKHCLSADEPQQIFVETDDIPRPVKIGRYEATHNSSQGVSRLSNVSVSKPQHQLHNSRRTPHTESKKKLATVTSSEFLNMSSGSSKLSSTVSTVAEKRRKIDNTDHKFNLDDDSSNIQMSVSNVEIDNDYGMETSETACQSKQLKVSSLAIMGKITPERSPENIEKDSIQTFDISQIKTEGIKGEEPELELTGISLGGDTGWAAGPGHSSSASELQLETGNNSNQSETERSASHYFRSQEESVSQFSSNSSSKSNSELTKELPFECDQFNSSSGNFSGLKYECQFCKKTFPSKYNYRRHQLIHTGERPFTCDVCKQCFRQKAHLQRHAAKHHLMPHDQDSSVVNIG